MSQFGKNLREAHKNYRDFVEGIDPSLIDNPGKSPKGGFILGSEAFIEWVKEQFLSLEPEDKEKPQLKSLKSGIEIGKIVSIVAESFGVEPKHILARGKKRNLARDVAIYFAKNLTGYSGEEIGEHFGAISGAAITMRHKAVVNQLKTDKKLNALMKRLKKQIINI